MAGEYVQVAMEVMCVVVEPQVVAGTRLPSHVQASVRAHAAAQTMQMKGYGVK